METSNHEVSWASIRDQFTIPVGSVYLNSGTWGLSPRCVVDTAVKYTRMLESNPLKNMGVCETEVNKAKQKLAEHVGACPEDMVFMTNSRMALNGIIRCLRGLEQGSEILCTDQEYGAIDNIWQFVAERRNLSIKRVPLPKPPESAEQIMDLFIQNLSDRTQVITFCHITSQTGLIMPAKRLCRLARDHGLISIVDGAHAPGMIPLNLTELDCDYYAGSCHKWLCSAKGAAFAYAKKPMQARLQPFLIEHGWQSDSRFPYGFQGCGTQNSSAYISVGTAVDFQQSIGIQQIAARTRELASYAKTRLMSINGAQLLTPASEELSGAMATYIFTETDSDQLAQKLELHGIHIPHWRGSSQTSAEGKGSQIRLSTHIYNDREQIDLLATLIEESQHGM